VRTGLCKSPSEWPWSSHRATLGEAEPPSFLDVAALLSYYGPDVDPARRRYREDAERADASDAPRHPLVVGDDAFVDRALARLRPAPRVPRRYFRPPWPALPTLLTSTAGEAAIAAAHAHGYPLCEIARHLGVNASTVSRRLRRHRLRSEGATAVT
jgi:transcriptional regulator of acetoin/glycerol metabolism